MREAAGEGVHHTGCYSCTISQRRRSPMATTITVDALLDRVQAMAPMLRAYSAEAEAQRRLSRPEVEPMCQAELYSMAHPQAVGGLEVVPLTMLRLVGGVGPRDGGAAVNFS